MAANLEEELIDKVRALPANKQRVALRLRDTLVNASNSAPNGGGTDRRPIWEIAEEVNAALPEDTWTTCRLTVQSILIITCMERRSANRESRIR